MRATGMIGTAAALLLFGLSAAARGDEAPAPVKLREKLDVRYYPGKERQLADIFTPEGDTAHPVVIFVHGGGWVIGDKNLLGLYRGVARWIAKQGYTVVTINYRLSPHVQHPEHCKDVARAFAWVRQNIKEYGGDPDRIILAGHSAGGHMVTLVGSDAEFLKDPELKLTDADRAALKGIISICGVYRILDEAEFVKVTSELVASLTGMAKLPDIGNKVVGVAGMFAPKESINPLRLAFGNDKAVYAAASPINFVRKGLPPMLLLTAGTEIPPLREQAMEYSEKLKEAGVDVTWEKIPNADHNTIMFFVSWPNNPTGKALAAFLKKVTGEGKK
jgi:acetyl esterase/lipase